MRTAILFIAIMLTGWSAEAQPEKKTAPALHNFLNTEFMIKYRDFRIECESNALQVQASGMHLDPQAVFRLRAAFDQTATRSNQLLENIKQDFLNNQKLKSIAQFPEMYSDGLRFKLQEISDYYNSHYMQALADATPMYDELDGGPGLLLLMELVGLVNGLTRHFAELRREARFYNDKYLQENLVKPYRWQYWDELSGGGSRYEQYDRHQEMVRPDGMRQDQLEQRLQRVGETMNQMKNNNPGAPNEWQYDTPNPDFPILDANEEVEPDWSPYSLEQSQPEWEEDKKTEPKKVEPVNKTPAPKKKNQ